MNPTELQDAETEVARLRQCCQSLQTQMATVLIGQSEVVRLLLTGLISGGHMLVIGVPGLAKTMMVKALADLLGWDFRRIQFTPDLMPADITGHGDLAERRERAAARPGVPSRAGVCQPDSGGRNQPHAAQNPGGAAGGDAGTGRHGQRQDLPPGAAVHRRGHAESHRAGRDLSAAGGATGPFHVQHPRGLPGARRRSGDCRRARCGRSGTALRRWPRRRISASFTQIIDQMPVSRRMCWNTRWRSPRPAAPRTAGADEYVRRYVAWGAGPRASQHLVTAAKASALLDGRPSPEMSDLERMAAPVLRHRIIPNYNALGEGIESDAIVKHLLETIRQPTGGR